MKSKLWETLSCKIAEGIIDMDTALKLGSIIEDIRHVAAVEKCAKRRSKLVDPKMTEALELNIKRFVRCHYDTLTKFSTDFVRSEQH